MPGKATVIQSKVLVCDVIHYDVISEQKFAPRTFFSVSLHHFLVFSNSSFLWEFANKNLCTVFLVQENKDVSFEAKN